MRTTDTKREPVYEELRPLLFSIAYRMVGSTSDAEDIVQEAFLRFHRESRRGTDIASPKAWLSTVTTRLAINHVQSARVRRERYVGTWLPEPLVTEPAGLRHAETADSLSLAFLVLLESLGPVERAVFLLREVFDYGYDEIAAVVGKSPDNCRQIAVRARRQIQARKPRFEASRRKRQELSRRFFEAVEADDTQGLVRLLADDVVVYADGGGKSHAPTIRRPLYGRERVARMVGEIGPWSQRLGARSVRYAEVNGQPGALYLDPDGHPVLVLSLDIADDLVQTVHAITNPDKLRHLTPPTDPD
jgi:RNA polymerase sigma-70 factor, ECF subfamily